MGGEPHYSGNFGLLPPGVMVVYTPRDEVERNVCRLLFSISNNCALGVTSSNNTESYMLRRNAKRCRTLEQAVAGRNMKSAHVKEGYGHNARSRAHHYCIPPLAELLAWCNSSWLIGIAVARITPITCQSYANADSCTCNSPRARAETSGFASLIVWRMANNGNRIVLGQNGHGRAIEAHQQQL